MIGAAKICSCGFFEGISNIFANNIDEYICKEYGRIIYLHIMLKFGWF